MEETKNTAVSYTEYSVFVLARVLECSTKLVRRALATGMTFIQIQELEQVAKHSGCRFVDAVRATEKIIRGLNCDANAAQIDIANILDTAADTGLGVDTCVEIFVAKQGNCEGFYNEVECREQNRDQTSEKFKAITRNRYRRYDPRRQVPPEDIPVVVDDEEGGDLFEQLSDILG